MSKSLNNFVTIQDVLKKYKPDVLKLFFLSAHYGSPIDFTFDSLEKSKKGYEKIEEFLDKIAASKKKKADKLKIGAKDQNEIDSKRRDFEAAMDDDFNTAKGLAVLFDLLSIGNKCLALRAGAAAVYVSRLLTELGGVLGLSLKAADKLHDFSSVERVKVIDSSKTPLDPQDVEKLILERRQARKKKDFKRADEIRDHLKDHGILIEDTGKTS
jgi:cysteinyl-tRNA synthetase